MATLTKSTGTVTLSGAAEKVTLPAAYGWVWLKNMSDADMFAGLSADISEGADGVMVIPSGECGRIQTDGFNSIYLMGTGNALVVAQNYADCPFKASVKGGESPDLSLYAKKTDIPTELPANGGDADTVNGHTVNADVPENAKFTDTIPDLSPYAKKTDIPTELPANGGSADYATNAGNAEKLGGKDASAYSTSIIKSVTFSAATTNGYIWTGIAFPKYVIGVDLGHFDVFVQFYKGNHVDAARAEWTMMFFSKDDVTTPLNGSFNGVIYYIDQR